MFYYDRGLFLASSNLAIDVCRRQPCGFISHAHADHIARHELVLCTPATARLCRHRQGRSLVRHLQYGQTIHWGRSKLTALPAGHVLGSAMLLVEDAGRRLLYTGDFRLGPSATAAEADPPKADVLIMETTFGHPRYRLPTREAAADQLVTLVHSILADGATPVIHAYVLGKAQEVTRVLTDAGIPVLQHPLVYQISQIYEECGCPLGRFSAYSDRPRVGHAVIVPPRSQRAAPLEGLVRPVRIAVTGWAADAGASRRWRVDHAVAFSDHADFDQLWQLIEAVQPEEIFCTHGPPEFAQRLRESGHRAYVLGAEK